MPLFEYIYILHSYILLHLLHLKRIEQTKSTEIIHQYSEPILEAFFLFYHHSISIVYLVDFIGRRRSSAFFLFTSCACKRKMGCSVGVVL